jgi:hypothetical protein
MTFRMTWQGPQITKDVHNAAASGLFEAASFLLEESDDLIPHDTGDMMTSGVASVDESKLTAAVAYGGPSTPYTVRQHEDTRLRHPPYNGKNRESKWLEKTFNRHGKRAWGFVVAKLKSVF